MPISTRFRIPWYTAILFAFGCGRVTPPPPTLPPPAVTVVRPPSVPVQEFFEYNGYLEAIESVEIRARVEGFLDEITFQEGDEVKRGDRLYRIDPREYEAAVSRATADIARAAADAENAKAQVNLAQAELDRLSRLSAAASRSEFDRAVATLAANKAQLDVATANKSAAEAARRTAELRLSYTDIRSPIDGRISRTLVTRGNLVGQGGATLLTTIVSVDPLFVYFDVPERDLVEYQQDLREHPGRTPEVGQFPVEVGVATETGYPHRGFIDFRENRVDIGTGTVRIRGRIPNPASQPGNVRILYPGLYARVRVPEAVGPRPRPVLPEESLMTGQEGRFVFVVGPDGIVQKRSVTVGPQVWRRPPNGEAGGPPGWELVNPNPPPASSNLRAIVAVDSGLSGDDLVIVNGLQRARPGLPVAPEVWELRTPHGPGE